MSVISYYVWQGENIMANVTAHHKNTKGGYSHGVVGQSPIARGDIVSLNYGANKGVYTASGIGYEVDYPHGYMTRFGDGASIELNAKTAPYLKRMECSRLEFDKLVAKQKEKYLVDDLVAAFEAKIQSSSEVNHLPNKKNISCALDKMENAFKKK